MQSVRARLLALSLTMSLAACAASSDRFPSLATRDAERITGTAQPDAPAIPLVVPAPPQLVNRVEQLRADAGAAAKAFDEQAGRSQGALAALSTASQGSESWASAISALAQLEGLRSRTMVILADLDRLFVDAAVAGGDLSQISVARDEVAARVDRQDAAIAAALARQ